MSTCIHMTAEMAQNCTTCNPEALHTRDMIEAPKTIHLLTSDAVLFAQKYGHPKLEMPCVGDDFVEYHHHDTVTSLEAKAARYEAALRDVINPMGYLRKCAEQEGAIFTGGAVAVSIAHDHALIKDIAREALGEAR